MSEDFGSGFICATVVWLVVFSVLVLIASATSYSNGFQESSRQWRVEMIQRGQAHYDAKTAEWKWNDNGTKKEN